MVRLFVPDRRRSGRFIGTSDVGCGDTVATDGMHELRREHRDEGFPSYCDFGRTDCAERHIGRFRSDADAIAAWRRMLREGEL